MSYRAHTLRIRTSGTTARTRLEQLTLVGSNTGKGQKLLCLYLAAFALECWCSLLTQVSTYAPGTPGAQALLGRVQEFERWCDTRVSVPKSLVTGVNASAIRFQHHVSLRDALVPHLENHIEELVPSPRDASRIAVDRA